MRQQLTASLRRTAETALPAPTLETDEIHLLASASERDALANDVVMLANQYGGSAAKAPPDEAGITVLADLPAIRADEFRQALLPLAQTDFSSRAPGREKPAANEKDATLASRSEAATARAATADEAATAEAVTASEAATARVNIYVRISQTLRSPGP